MPRGKSSFVCRECGYVSPGWLGRCPGCGSGTPSMRQRRRSLPSLERPAELSEHHYLIEIVPLREVMAARPTAPRGWAASAMRVKGTFIPIHAAIR